MLYYAMVLVLKICLNGDCSIVSTFQAVMHSCPLEIELKIDIFFFWSKNELILELRKPDNHSGSGGNYLTSWQR